MRWLNYWQGIDRFLSRNNELKKYLLRPAEWDVLRAYSKILQVMSFIFRIYIQHLIFP
jgi:hypothetical protein